MNKNITTQSVDYNYYDVKKIFKYIMTLNFASQTLVFGQALRYLTF